MKLSTGLFIVGGVVVLGAVAYAIYQSQKAKSDNTYEVEPANGTEHTGLTRVEPVDEQDMPPVHEVKSEVATSVVERHAEAAEAVKESLDAIYSSDDKEVVITENTEKLDKIGKDLDDILK